MDALMLDGNAVAGMLQQVFAIEMTTALGTCRECGATDVMGATRVFRGAGIVMRCGRCNYPLVTIGKGDESVWIGFPGLRTLEVRLGDAETAMRAE